MVYINQSMKFNKDYAWYVTLFIDFSLKWISNLHETVSSLFCLTHLDESIV